MNGWGLDALPQSVAIAILVLLGIALVGLTVSIIVRRANEADGYRDALLQDECIRRAAASRPRAEQPQQPQQPRD